MFDYRITIVFTNHIESQTLTFLRRSFRDDRSARNWANERAATFEKNHPGWQRQGLPKIEAIGVSETNA